MREKKRILILDANEQRRSIRRFLLTNKGFKVFTHEKLPDYCDLVIAGWPIGEEAKKTAQVYQTPLLLLVDKLTTKAPLEFGATHILSGDNCAPWAIVEAAICMSARQRGPQPKKPVVTILPDGRIEATA